MRRSRAGGGPLQRDAAGPVGPAELRHALPLVRSCAGRAGHRPCLADLFRFRGGKAIAVSFGVLLGIAPVCPVPLAALAFFYLFFSLVVRISPHAWRSIAAFLAAGLAGRALAMPASLVGGVRLIVLIVCGKHLAALHRNPEPVRLRLFHS